MGVFVGRSGILGTGKGISAGSCSGRNGGLLSQRVLVVFLLGGRHWLWRGGDDLRGAVPAFRCREALACLEGKRQNPQKREDIGLLGRPVAALSASPQGEAAAEGG